MAKLRPRALFKAGYRYKGTWKIKKNAEDKARSLRKAGYSVRINPTYVGYEIYYKK